jgi:hypothetical protein
MELLLWKINVLIFKLRLWFWKHSWDNLNIEKYVKLQIQHGLIYNDLSPKRCICGCKELVEYGHDYLDTTYHGTLLEYSAKCKKCGANLGHWAYGYWQA